MSKTYCYIRVSTEKQSYARQEFLLKERGYINNDNCIYVEETGSGKAINKREVLIDLLNNILEPGDTLVATDLTRISRSVPDFRNVMDFLLKKKKANLILLKENFSFYSGEKMDAMTKAMVNFISVFAEFERDIISDRVTERMAEIKENGTKSGKPIGHPRSNKNTKEKFIKTLSLVASGESLRKACDITLYPLGTFTYNIKKYKDVLKTDQYLDILKGFEEGIIEYGI